jgi:hypothetical protein
MKTRSYSSILVTTALLLTQAPFALAADPLPPGPTLSASGQLSSIVISPATPPAGTVNDPYPRFSFTARGGSPPYSWKVTHGSPPPGLSVGRDGSVTGTPTMTGTFSFSVTATDSPQTVASAPPLAIQIVISKDAFTPTGGMFSTRESHTATLLHDGHVLVVGGTHRVYCLPCFSHLLLITLASAEIYDPGARQFAITGKMSVPRVFHTATLLASGKVLITGGDNRRGTDYATAELFNPATGLFAPTGSMLNARSSHTATWLSDGKVLVTGGVGQGGALATAEVFDPATGKFTQTGKMTSPRFFHTATLLSDGRVLIAGGDNGSGTNSTAELYNPATGTFARTGSMSVERALHRAILLTNRTVLVIGGSSAAGAAIATAEIFNPVSGKFARTGSMHSPRQDHTATRLPDGQVLVTGGVEGVSSSIDLASSELFDPAIGTFADAGNMETRRLAHTATLLTNGDVLIAGGENFESPLYSLATAELFP